MRLFLGVDTSFYTTAVAVVSEEGGLVGDFRRVLDVPAGEFKSVICLPIIFSRKTRGVLTLADQRALPVTEELKAFASMVAENLALFLENLHFRTRLDVSRPARPKGE